MNENRSACDFWNPSDCEGSLHCPPRCPRLVDKHGVPWVVRPFEPDDREPLFEMYRDFDADDRAQGLPPFGENRLEDWVDTLLEDGCNFVATDNDGRVVGHALYTPADAAEPELAVFVHQDAQGRGIGTELCRHVIATAAAGDRDALVLDVEPSNEAAVNVYESIGFRRDEEPPASEDTDGRICSLRMRHPLTRADAAEVQRPPALRG